mmetsp:Transcript_62614/g.183110  ORF Transcript_62614/g.183110 Transcript_62614/m.183110 type:complete len:527 (+) Transcript_62614:82-1662(+)
MIVLLGLLVQPATANRWAGRSLPFTLSATSPVERERRLQEFGVARYPDWPPQPTWGDLSTSGRLGATCDADSDAAAQCGVDLVCRNGICRHCINHGECPSLHRCYPMQDGSRCLPIGKKAWEQALADKFEGLCTIIIFFAAALAAAAGTGGGGMFVPLLTSLSGLKPEQAVPLSQVMILSGSIVNISVFLAQRHPKHPSQPVIDYNCVVLLAPMLFLGVTFGVLINQMSPQWLLLLLLCLSLGFALWRSGSKGLKQLRTEQDSLPNGSRSPRDTPRPVNQRVVFLELTNKNAWQLIGIVSVWLLMLVSSGHGIAVCSTRFAVFLAVLTLMLVGCTAMAGRYIARVSPELDTVGGMDQLPRWVSRNNLWSFVQFPVIGYGAGFLGGLLGLGGGIIMSPVLLEVGMHSEAVQATTAVFVLLSSSLATIQFAVLGQHVWDYVLWYCAVTVAATLLGQHLCEVFVRKSGRYSLITFAIAAVLGASLLGLLVVGSQRVVDDLSLGRQMWFSAKRLCSGGGLGIVVVDVLPA